MVFLWGEDGDGLPPEQPRDPGPAHARGLAASQLRGFHPIALVAALVALTLVKSITFYRQ